MKAKLTLLYALFGFLVGALTQALTVLITLSTTPIESPSRWAIAAGAGIIAAGIAAALPYLRAALPTPPA